MEITFKIVAGNQEINEKGGRGTYYYVYVIMMNLGMGCHFDQDNRTDNI